MRSVDLRLLQAARSGVRVGAIRSLICSRPFDDAQGDEVVSVTMKDETQREGAEVPGWSKLPSPVSMATIWTVTVVIASSGLPDRSPR